MNNPRIAVLVDGDNISAKHSAKVLAEAGKRGRIDVSRVYAGMNHPTDWLVVPGYRVMHAGAGKNAADLLLSIDAMELALAKGIEAFIIATSDRDYTHLAQRLREYGRHVLGLGEKKTPEAFRMACSEFVFLPEAEPKAATVVPQVVKVAPPVEKVAPARAAVNLDTLLRNTIAAASKDGRGMLMTQLAAKMHATHSIKIGSYPERTWRAYILARPALFEIDPRGPQAMVRLRNSGSSGK